MKTFMFLAIFSLMLVGCASQPTNLVIQTPGPLSEVHRTSTTTTTPTGTTTTSSQESTELTPAMAEMKMTIAQLRADVEKAKAKPVYYPGGYYNNGGYVQSYSPPRPRPGAAYGTNITYRTQ